jgi:hypothetical protein
MPVVFRDQGRPSGLCTAAIAIDQLSTPVSDIYKKAAPLTYFVNLYFDLLFVISLRIRGPWACKARLALALKFDSYCLNCRV